MPSTPSSTGTARLADLTRLCIHTVTTRPWSLDDAIAHYAGTGAAGITFWREAGLEPGHSEPDRFPQVDGRGDR